MTGNLIITVAGGTGDGKTTVSQLIANALRQYQVSVQVIDQDGDVPKITNIAERMHDLLVRRNLHVEIRQQQLPPRGISKDMEHG